jgi:hypothetical protein
VQVFEDPHVPEQERPGQNRFFFDTSGEESFEIQLGIYTVNGLRTNEFSQALNPGDYLPSEIQQDCVFPSWRTAYQSSIARFKRGTVPQRRHSRRSPGLNAKKG